MDYVGYVSNKDLFYYVKWAAIIQLIVLFGLIVVAYYLKAYYAWKNRLYNKKKIEIEQLLTKVSSHPNGTLSDKTIKLLQRYLRIVLDLIPKFDNQAELPYWTNIRDQLIKKVLNPKARKMATSRHWLDRYHAVMAFQYDLNEENKKCLLSLIKDKIFLVSLNAAKVSLKSPTPNLINTIIDTYSQGRKMQQSTFSEVLAKNENNTEIIPIIFNRLTKENNPYVKTFCYRLLSKLPHYEQLAPTLEEDLNTKNRDLEISTLEYLRYYADDKTVPLIRAKLNHDDWQVKAVAARILGQLHDTTSTPVLTELLNDPQWWVRGNAANALYSMGTEGREILESQKSESDPIAYEISQYVLNTAKE